jgi:GTP-binding protein
VQETLEKLSTHDSIRAITFAEVVILVMDANNAFETQDLQLADLVEREGRGLIFCISKWDLVENQSERLAELREQAERVLPQVRGTPMIALSAETGRGVERLMPAVFGMHKNWSTKVKTRDLNDWLAMAVQRHPPPAVNGKRIKPKYMAQLKGRPPTFVLFASRADHLPESYRRYLINSLRESFDLPGVPIRITIKANKNPYAEEGDGNRSVASSADGPSKHVKKKIASHKKTTVADITPAPRPAKPAKAKPAGPKSFRVGQKPGPQKTGPKRSEVKAAQGKAAAKRAGQRTPTTHKLRKPPVKKGPPKR